MINYTPTKDEISYAYFTPYDDERQQSSIKRVVQSEQCHHTVLASTYDNNAIDLESDLRGMTRTVNRDEIPKNTHLTHRVDRIESNMSRLNSSATDQSRVTNPAWWHKDEQQYRPDILFYNPQDRIIPDFKSNSSSRIEQKN